MDDVYQPIRSNFLPRDPLHDLKDAFATIFREESIIFREVSHRVHTCNVFDKHQPNAFVINFNNNFQRRSINNNNNSRCPNLNFIYVGHHIGTVAKLTAIGSLRLTDSVVYNGKPSSGICNSAFVCYVSKQLWHCRLGHPVDQVLSVIGNKLCFNKHDHISPCNICHKAEHTRGLFPLSDHKSRCFGELVHFDVRGPYKFVSNNGYKYFLTIVDDYSRPEWVYLLKYKSEVPEYIESLIELVITQSGLKAKMIKSDNGINTHGSERAYDEKGGTSNEDGNALTSDDYVQTVENEECVRYVGCDPTVLGDPHGSHPIEETKMTRDDIFLALGVCESSYEVSCISNPNIISVMIIIA
ncbi:ribonuclease H-like domain-containing protein [Tanacetum coccineum]|uniref:Ribonuclease H-like domain-containing protein n=1 Tax=Tanacetum coccineum TaxID=301880 RepID=A0ABQ4YF60_9ASTR